MKYLVLIALAVPLWAQNTLKVDTNLVVLDVSVKDKAGSPVTNLKKEDFEILENGRVQTISVFASQRLRSSPLEPISFTIAQPFVAPISPRISPINSGIFPAYGDFQDRRLIVLLFDFASMRPDDRRRSYQAAVNFVASQMTSADLLAIMAFGTNLEVVADFTDDREKLIGALGTLNWNARSAMDALIQATAPGTDGSDDAVSSVQAELRIFNTDRQLKVLEEASKMLGTYPQKKALVYFSSGMPKTGIENVSLLKAAVNSAVRANVSFYPIDARGLIALPPGGDASTSPSGMGILTGTVQQSLLTGLHDSQATLYTLATETGGKSLLDSNDLALGIRQAQDDIDSYYILGFYSTDSVEDRKFRHLQVRLVKALQAKIDYRNGYYSTRVSQNTKASDSERQLQETLTLGDPVNKIPLALEVDNFRIAKDHYFVPISVKIPLSDVKLVTKGTNEIAKLDFAGQLQDSAARKVVGDVRDQITVTLDEGNAFLMGRRYLQYDTGWTVPSGSYNLIFIARDSHSGNTGTFEARFVIPDLSSERSLRVSSVVIGSQKEPVSPTASSANRTKKQQRIHPFEEERKLIPSITRVLRQDQVLYVYFEVYDPELDAVSRRPSVIAELSLLSGNRKAFTADPVRVTQLVKTRPGVAVFNFEVPLLALQSDEYVLQVSILDEFARKFSFPRSSILLLP